jgi:hypothetical protein
VITTTSDGMPSPSVQREADFSRGRVIDAEAPEILVQRKSITGRLQYRERSEDHDVLQVPRARSLAAIVPSPKVCCVDDGITISYSVCHGMPA